MTGSWKHYHTPGTIEEAIAVLHGYDGRARVIGGGTDLLVETRRGLRRPYDAMVDASRIAGLDTISQDQEHI
ncbi:MAG: FAD binding domain-containing protein, partial [Woeseiaceae bacterium]